MKARRLLENSVFDPEDLAIMFQAFDAAWAEIADHFDPQDTNQVERARMRLAHAVLTVASEDGNDPVSLKNDALQIMALAYRRRASA